MKKLKKLKWLIPLFIPFIFFISASCSIGFKAKFYNYQGYISNYGKNEINKEYEYAEFPLLEDFEQIVKNRKTVGGIGSDYAIVKLIKEGYLSKINYDIVFPNHPDDITTLFTKQVQKINTLFSQDIGDVDKDGKKDFLLEYMVPYFLQDVVIAYNKNKITISKEVADGLTWEDSLKGLKTNGLTNLIINDDFRNNTMIGSEKVGKFSNNINENNYKSYIEGFLNTIKDSTGYPINQTSNIKLSTSGSEELNDLIDPNKDWQAAILYNGDALDAYYSEDNFSNVKEGSIKIIKPKNSIYVLDGFVVSKYISTKEKEKLETTVSKAIYQGYDKTVYEKNEDEEYKDAIAKNFDFVNYTPVTNKLYNFMKNNYFTDGDKVDTDAQRIYLIDEEIKRNNIPSYLSDELQHKVMRLYNEYTKG